MGYPGALGPPEDPPPPGIEPLEVTADTAARLRRRRRRLGRRRRHRGGGAGGRRTRRDRDRGGRLLLGGGLRRRGAARLLAPLPERRRHGLARRGIGLLAGACLGGGTVVNYTFSFRTPDHVRREWASMGVPAVDGPAFDREPRRGRGSVSVNDEHSVPSAATRRSGSGLDRLGWDSQRDEAQRARLRARRGLPAVRLRLPAGREAVDARRRGCSDAYDGGTRILVRTRADRVIVEGGAARGVEARRRRRPPRDGPLARGRERRGRVQTRRRCSRARGVRTKASASTCACTR